MSTPSGSSRHGGEDYLYAGDAYFQRDRMTQLIKCTPSSMRLCPHPRIAKKMRTFQKLKGKWVQYPNPSAASIGPISQTLAPMSGKTRPWRREKGQHPPKDLGLTQTPSLVKQPCPHPWQPPRPQPMTDPKCKKKLQITDPHPQKMSQSAKAPHSPMLERFQEIFLRKEKIGYFLPTTWTMTIKTQLVSPAQNFP